MSQVRPLARTAEVPPLVRTVPARVARVGVALGLPMAPDVNVLEAHAGDILHLRQHPLAVDQHVLHAPHQERRSVRQFAQVAGTAADEGGWEAGVRHVVVLVDRDRVDRLLVVGRQDQVGRVDCNKYLN